MLRRAHLRGALLPIMLAALAGCEPKGVAGAHGVFPSPGRMITLDDASGQLGLYVAHASRTSATLRNGGNTVVLYPDPEGEVYINGSPLPDSAGVVSAGASLLVPAPLAARIRLALRPGGFASPEPPAPLEVPEPPRPARPVASGRVVLDPGHGGKDPGATSVLGFREKDLVLTVSALVAGELQRRGVEVAMTRTGDQYLELEDRPAMADRLGADLFVSIHADAAANKAATGFTVYVSRTASRGSLAAARAILRRLSDSCEPSRGMKNADFKVLINGRTPAVLVELGYLSNRWEASRLNTRSYQQRLAAAVADGICDFLRSR